MKKWTEMRTCSICHCIYETADPLEKEDFAICSLLCAREALKNFHQLQTEVDAFVEIVSHFI